MIFFIRSWFLAECEDGVPFFFRDRLDGESSDTDQRHG